MFMSRFGSILRKFDYQTNKKYMNWFVLNLYIFFNKTQIEPNKRITGWFELD